MKLPFFGKNKKTQQQPVKAPEVEVEAQSVAVQESGLKDITSAGNKLVVAYPYTSEKATLLATQGQYVFRVQNKATKSEVKKQIGKLYNVKVRAVKIMNMPEKERNVGRHSGIRSGFRKAIVVLAAGQTIGQAKI